MPEQQQEPIEGLDTARVRFVDMSLDELGNPPEIDDEMQFTVNAVCVARSQERMKDGELRRTAKMRVLSLSPNGPATKSSSGPNLFSVDE
jgi:hypothetical protein